MRLPSLIKYYFTRKLAVCLFLLATCFSLSANQRELTIAVSIKPIHSLVAAVTESIHQPTLIFDGIQSPHMAHLKPSQLSILEKSDLIIYVDQALEPQVAQYLKRSSKVGQAIKLTDIKPLASRLPQRKSHDFTHQHHEHNHHHHTTGTIDPHIWLNPLNAISIITALKAKLIEINPEAKEGYEANAKRLTIELKALDKSIEQSLSKQPGIAYVTLHDAYQYLERRYQLNNVSSVLPNLSHQVSIKRYRQLTKLLEAQNVKCAFAEPQLQSPLLIQLSEDYGLTLGLLDPIGANINSGKQHYFKLLQEISAQLAQCFDKHS